MSAVTKKLGRGIARNGQSSTKIGASSGNAFNAMHKACTRIGSKVFNDSKAIDTEAIQMLAGLPVAQARELLGHLEEKGSQVTNPSSWIKASVRRALGQGGVSDAADSFNFIHKACTRIGARVFDDSKAIDTEAIQMLAGLHDAQAMELLGHLEEKGSQVTNPSSWIKASVRRALGQGGVSDAADSFNGIHKACTRIGSKVFNDSKAIDTEAIQMLAGLPDAQARELLGHLEEKGSQVTNPSSWIKASVRRALGQGGVSDAADSFNLIHKACTRIGARVFDDSKAIDTEAIQMLAGIHDAQAMELLGHLEEKGSQVTNPSSWIKASVRRALGQGGVSDAADSFNLIHKACTGIGARVFNDSKAIDTEAIQMLAGLHNAQARELLGHLEEKGSQVTNPSSWIKASVRRALGQGGVSDAAVIFNTAGNRRGGGGSGAKRGRNLDEHAVVSKVHKRFKGQGN